MKEFEDKVGTDNRRRLLESVARRRWRLPAKARKSSLVTATFSGARRRFQ